MREEFGCRTPHRMWTCAQDLGQKLIAIVKLQAPKQVDEPHLMQGCRAQVRGMQVESCVGLGMIVG